MNEPDCIKNKKGTQIAIKRKRLIINKNDNGLIENPA
jgi:hypothetical protein